MDTSGDVAAAPEEENARAQVDGTPAFRRCLEAVRLNDTCFASWSLLVAEAERSQNPFLGDVYERLLAAFPPLYGYWAKAAQYVVEQAKEGALSPQACRTILDRAQEAC